MGLSGRQLRGLRPQAVTNLFKKKQTSSVGLRLLSSSLGAQICPSKLYHGIVVFMWARAVGEGPRAWL
eukprot:1346984-Pyramimonas_sp.AAC.1